MLPGRRFCVDMTSSVNLGMIRANRKVVQRGVLEATPHSLIFTDDLSQMKQLWPLKSLRNIEATSDKVFVMETADPSSEARIFSFSTPEAKQLQFLVLHLLHVMINSEQPHHLGVTHSGVTHSGASGFPASQTIPIAADETGPTHWKLNTRSSMESSSSSSTISPTHSRTPSTPRDVFDVDRILEDSSKKEHGTLEAVENEIIFVESGGAGKRIAWPVKCLRRFGYEGDIFTLEVGRKAPGGEGRHRFKTSRAAEINTAVKNSSVSGVGRNSPPSPAVSERISKTHPQQFPFASPIHRALPPTPPSQPALPPLTPSQALLYPPAKHLPLPPPPSQPLPPLPSQPLPPTSSVQIQHHRYSHHSMTPRQMRDIETENQKLSSSSPAFSQPDSLVRRTHSSYDVRPNIFEVRNISDDKKEVGQGTVEVTSTDLIYIDSKTQEKWKWPVRFLRKYGYEENIFSFEAGRRCPGGHGLYAFLSERANEIHETILESVRDQGKQVSPPVKVPFTPEHSKGAASGHSRYTSADDQAVPPALKLANNHYNENGTVKIGTPTSNLMTSQAAQPTTPYSVESIASPLNSSPRVSSVDPSSTTGKGSSNAKAHGKQQTHHYDLLSHYGQESNARSSQNQPVIGNGVITKKPVSPNQSSEQSRTAADQRKRNAKSDQKRISESNPDVSDDTAVSGGVGKDVGQKQRSKVLSRLIGKKSKRKIRRESTDNVIDAPSYRQGGDTGEDMYVNLKNGVVARSASCDDILSSCNESDSKSLYTKSAVPLPQLDQSHTPPINRRSYEGNYRPEQRPISVPSSSVVLYQNLNDLVSHVDRSHSDPSQAPPTLPDANENSHLYSNVSLMAIEDLEHHQPQTSTMYAEVEICSTGTPPFVTPHDSPRSSPRSSPHPPHLNLNGRITSTSTKIPPITKPKPSQSSDRQRSSSVHPAGKSAAKRDQSPHVRSQSESYSGNYITSNPKVVGGSLGVTSVMNNDEVIYAPLDFAAIDAVAQIKRDHADIRNFDEILKRHDIREMEMDRKKRRNVMT